MTEVAMTELRRPDTALAERPHEQPVALSLPDSLDFNGWVSTMANLFQRRRQADWLIADGLRIGKERFGDEPQMQLFIEQAGLDRKEADEMARVARLIPDSWRTDRLSFDVCRKIAKVDDEEDRRSMLKRAVDERWNEKAAHHHLVEYRYEHGELFEEDDRDTRLAVEGIRWWNRSPPEAREYFFALAEIAAANGFTPIDEDKAI